MPTLFFKIITIIQKKLKSTRDLQQSAKGTEAQQKENGYKYLPYFKMGSTSRI